jgi:hypothetical protein
MTTEWAVAAAAEQFDLDSRNVGELTFTISNPGEAADTVVFDVIPGEGTQRSWFSVPDPQRLVPGHDSASFLVRLAVPAGTAPRRYDMTGLAYSANTAPEESSRSSGRVTYEVRATEKPQRIWPWLILALILVLMVGGVVTWLLTRPSDDGPTPLASVTLEAESLVPAAKVQSPAGTAAKVVVQENCCKVTWSKDHQLWFQGMAINDSVTVTVDIPQDGVYTFSTIRTTSFDYANTVWTVDGRAVGSTFLGFTSDVRITDWIDVGKVRLTKGPHLVTLTAVGATQGIGRYYAGVDAVRFTEVRS